MSGGFTLEGILVGGGIAALLLGARRSSIHPRLPTGIALLAVALAACLAGAFGSWASFGAASSTEATWTGVVEILLLGVAFLTLLGLSDLLARDRIRGGEARALVLFATVGASVELRSSDGTAILLGFQILLLALGALVGFPFRTPTARKGATKVLLMGGLVAASLALGLALYYRRLGTVDLASLATESVGGDRLLTFAVLILVAVAGWQLALAPLQGGLSEAARAVSFPVGALLALAPALAGTALLLRLLAGAPALESGGGWDRSILLLSAISMAVGGFLVLAQKELHRLLACTATLHGGFLLLALLGDGDRPLAYVAAFLGSYVLSLGGSYLALGALVARSGRPATLTGISGLGRRFPVVALALLLCVLSLAGVPPTSGFVARVLVLLQALRTGHPALATVAILSSLLALTAYLRLSWTLFMKDDVTDLPSPRWGDLSGLGSVLCAAGVLLLGVFPGPVLLWLEETLRTLG